jgi:hypothetical protein
MKYAGKNINTSDGTVAYVTDTGKVKAYATTDVYDGTSDRMR